MLHSGSPIVAGAGSGKTRVLTHRIAYLLATHRATPARFSPSPSPIRLPPKCVNVAEALAGPRAKLLRGSLTFHSFCVRACCAARPPWVWKSTFTIYDSTDSAAPAEPHH